MSTSTTHLTLAELAVRLPAASRVFKRHRLDFCCSGHRGLVEACLERGLDARVILAEIEDETGDTAELPSFEPAAIVTHLVEHYHVPLRTELGELVAMAERVETSHGQKPTCPHGLAAHLRAFAREVVDHLDKEESVLFPMLVAGAGRAVAQPIKVMQREHDDHGAALAKTRELTNDLTPPLGACATWRALYLRLKELESELMDHIHIENNILFPRALRGI